MLLYGCSFLGFFRLGINYRSIVSAERFPGEKNTKLHLAESGMGVKMQRDAEEILMAGKAGYKSLKARLTIPLPSCRFTLDQNSVPSDSDSASVASVNQP